MKALMRVEPYGSFWLVEFGRRSEIGRDEWYRLIAEESLKVHYVNAEFADLLPIVEPIVYTGLRVCSRLQTPALTRQSIQLAEDGMREDAERKARAVGLRIGEIRFQRSPIEATHETEVRMTAIAR